jgi:L-threonylcarbamoyladenylate synthase
MTLVLDTSPDSIARAAECLRGGGLVAFPTETVYGLGVHALDPASVRRLFEAKGRPPNDPLIVHVLAFEDAYDLLEEDLETGPYCRVRRLAARFWPGPLTLVVPKSARVPSEVTAGLASVAIRAPAHPVARALLEAAAIPIAAPSANLFSRPSPTRADHVLHDLEGRIDMVIDGGPTPVGVESTVLDLTADPPTVLRPGAVTIETLRELLPNVRHRAERAGVQQSGVGPELSSSFEASADRRSVGGGGQVGTGIPMMSPGLLSKHYSPQTPLTLYEGPRAIERLAGVIAEALVRGQEVGVLVPREHVARFQGAGVKVADLGPSDDVTTMASRLYAALRELDGAGLDAIFALGIEGEAGLAAALRDRLRRAAAGRIIHT